MAALLLISIANYYSFERLAQIHFAAHNKIANLRGLVLFILFYLHFTENRFIPSLATGTLHPFNYR